MMIPMLSLLAAAFAPLAMPGRAHACSCAVASTEEVLELTDLVFRGEALNSAQETGGWAQEPVQFRVNEVWKGPAEPLMEVNPGPGTCVFDFVQGQTYTVFARDSGGSWETGLCYMLGTEDADAVLGPGTPVPTAEPASYSPPAPDETDDRPTPLQETDDEDDDTGAESVAGLALVFLGSAILAVAVILVAREH